MIGTEAMLVGAGVVTALRFSSCLFSQRRAFRKVLRKRREDGHVSALCMPAKTGKSSLVQQLASNSNKDKVIVVDMDEMMNNLLTPVQARQVRDLQAQRNQTWISIAYPIIKEWFVKLGREFPKHRKIIVCNSVDLPEYLDILDTTVLAPCKKVVESLKLELTDEDKQTLEQSYLDMITSGRDVFYFSNFDSVKERVCNSYGLRESI